MRIKDKRIKILAKEAEKALKSCDNNIFSDKQLEVLFLRINEMTLEEIGSKLNITKQAVQNRFNYINKKTAKLYKNPIKKINKFISINEQNKTKYN